MSKALPYTEIIILSHKWKVKEVPEGHKELEIIVIDRDKIEPLMDIEELSSLAISVEGCYGRVDDEKHTIYINADAPYSEKIETLIHEIAHIIVMGFDAWPMDQEDYLRIFISVFYDTICRNKIRMF